MRRSRLSAIVVPAACWACLSTAAAQQQVPHAGYVFPAGGRQGTSAVVLVGGQYLDGVVKATISGSDVQAKVIDYFKPIRQGQSGGLQEKLKKLQEKKAAAAESDKAVSEGGRPKTATRAKWTEEDEMLMAATRKKLAQALRAPPVPATAETVVVQIIVAGDAKPGRREIRLQSPRGLTNPLAFCVGQLPEFSGETASLSEALAAKPPRYRDEPRATPPAPPVEITLPAVVNGQIMPGEVDRYRFHARKGQHLVIVAAAEELIPYISDAVPGWFQAALTLYDSRKRELAYADHYLFHPDPVLSHEVAEDGEYMIEIRDSIYRGREDFVYRLTVGEIPFITSIFPLGGPAGTSTAVAIHGWNLPAGQLTRDVTAPEPGIYPLTVHQDGLASNDLPFAADTLPECLEREPNNRPDEAQAVTLPTIINGHIDQPDDWDVFAFEGRAGSEIVAETYARRLGSPLDSVLKLTDAAGRQLAFNDDHEDKGAGLTTHHADSYLRATLPTAGTYYLHLGDAQHKGGPDYAYRLRISPPRPDFAVRIAPSSISVRGGTSVPVTVFALRKDGFADEIALALRDAPDGLALGGGSVPAGQDQAQLTLRAYATPQQLPVSLNLEGRATIQGREVVHPAVPAENMMQAFEYRHLVPTKELEVTVSGNSSFRATAKLVSKTPIKIPAGGTAHVQIAISPPRLFASVDLALRKPPQGIAIASVIPWREGLEIVFESDAAKVTPGQRGNLTLAPAQEKTTTPSQPKPESKQQRKLPTLPNVPFEIVRP